MQCESKTTKKAWRNPLAPMARCSREAKVTMYGATKEKPLSVCETHARKLEKWGWSRQAPSEHRGGDKACETCWGLGGGEAGPLGWVKCSDCGGAGQAPGKERGT